MDKEPFIFNSEKKVEDFSKTGFHFKKTILFFFGIVGVFVLFYIFLISGPNNFPNGIIFNIEKGSNLAEISESLKAKQMIRSKVLFEMFIVVYGGENHIAEGDYFFGNKVPVFEVARRIAVKERHLAPLKITIPEGYNNLEIAEVFSSHLRNFNKDKFLLEVKDKEGYLFPDTYFFFTTDTETNVIKSMNENFLKKIKTIEKDIYLSGKSEKDIIIMASIIEKEAKGDNDRGIISGILWNRLAKRMPLQVDAAMSTYKEKGLPKFPICNPGLKAILAAIHPVKSPYLYYLHDKNGLIHYAINFSEHKQNKIKYLK